MELLFALPVAALGAPATYGTQLANIAVVVMGAPFALVVIAVVVYNTGLLPARLPVVCAAEPHARFANGSDEYSADNDASCVTAPVRGGVHDGELSALLGCATNGEGTELCRKSMNEMRYR